MVVYNFKKIAPIPNVTDFIDIVLTRTQRRTPTVIHPGFKIQRIRNFYMRKVKFTQQTIEEKLGAIVADFPRLDDIHPFYADLMNILYDRDHFKLALGQVNMAKTLIQNLTKDYLRLMKYADSLYRCKQLKRAALGRMMTVLKKLKASLGYLEEIRKHISRLPALDPNTRTLLLTGYPNVGKSSFMNKVTRADVDVQPYAFTTKALFVGHMDHRLLRWQVVDTPGILDRPLEERNTIEMQAITALAHLQCCVLYFLDVSEQCGYPMAEQLKLFESIRPLFANKQVMIVANKTDVVAYNDLPAATRAKIEAVAETAGAELVPMSNVSEDNVSKLKTQACDKLLEARVDAKLSAGRVKDNVLSRITVAMPKPRDSVKREAFIPDSVKATLASSGNMDVARRITEKDLMLANGGAGVYSCDHRKYYTLDEDEWKYDAIPEFMDGKNVMDFFDEDIETRLQDLENEEKALEEQGAYAPEEPDEDELNEEELVLYEAIRNKQSIQRKESNKQEERVPKKIKNRTLTEDDIRAKLDASGYEETEGVVASMRSNRKRTRSETRGADAGDDEEMEVEGEAVSNREKRKRTAHRTRQSSLKVAINPASKPAKVKLTEEQKKQMLKKERSLQRHMFRHAKKGEADRVHYPKLVKHMNSGKRSLGTSTIGR